MQGEQQETGELRRLHLRLERANEHVNQLQSRLASQASTAGTNCSDQLAEAQHAQQAQQLEIETLRRQLAGSQASTSSSDNSSKEEELETKHAKQQVEIESLRQQLQEHRNSCGLDRDQQLERLRAEITQLQGALANATAGEAGPSRQPGAEANKLALTSEGTATAAGVTKQNGVKQDGGKQDAQLEVLPDSEWSLDSEPAQWCQLALQDRPAFCSRLGHLQQELQKQRADLVDRRADLDEQKAAAAQQKATISQQADRLAQAASDLSEKASALQRCSEEVATMQSQLTDCKSVTSLQSDQLAVLQAEVDQLRASLAAAEKLASGGEAAEQLQQEVGELRIRLQVSLPFFIV